MLRVTPKADTQN